MYNNVILEGLLVTTEYNQNTFAALVGDIIKTSFVHVLDDETSLDNLEGCEKTYIGTKIEKKFLKTLGLPHKKDVPMKLDTVINGFDVDIKHTIGQNWMIPPEAHNEWCILIKTDYPHSYSLGLIKATDEVLTKGKNRDQKRSLSACGKQTIQWITKDYSLA